MYSPVPASQGPTAAEIKEKHAKIERLAVENDFFVGRAEALRPENTRAMIKRDHPELSISQPCVLVRVEGLEPPRLAAPEPKSGASTNFATPA